MAILIEGLKIIITTDGGTGKGTITNPYTFSAIMVTATNIVLTSNNYSKRFFYVPYALWIEADCYFKSDNEMVLFDEDVDALGSRIRCTGFMEIISCLWRCNGDEFSVIYNATITNSVFYDFRGLTFYSGNIVKNTKFFNVGSTYWARGEDSEFTDCEMVSTAYGYIPQKNIAINLRNKFINCINGILLGYNSTADIRIESPQLIGCTYDLVYLPLQYTYNAIGTEVLVDPLVDLDKSSLLVTIDNRHCRVQIVTRMSFYIKDAENSIIKVYDKDSNLIYDSDYIEGLTDDIKYYERYVVSQGIAYTPLIDEEDIFQPFKVIVSKAGFDDLEIPNIYITSGQATTVRGGLVESTPPVYVSEKLTGEILAEEVLEGGIEEEEKLTGELADITLCGSIAGDTTLTGEIEVEEL